MANVPICTGQSSSFLMANIPISQISHGYPNIPVSERQYPNIPEKITNIPISQIGLTPPNLETHLETTYLIIITFPFAQDFQTAMDETGQAAEYVSAPCLMGLYIHHLLTEAYQLPDSQRNLHVIDKLNRHEICKSLQFYRRNRFKAFIIYKLGFLHISMRNRYPHRENVENILAIYLPIMTM